MDKQPHAPLRVSMASPAGEPTPKPSSRQVLCDLCGYTALELHCKIHCLNCGYMRDCSDP